MIYASLICSVIALVLCGVQYHYLRRVKAANAERDRIRADRRAGGWC